MRNESTIYLGSNYQTYELPMRKDPNALVTLCIAKGETGLYSIGDDTELDIIYLKSHRSGIKLLKGITGIDVSKLPKFTKSKKCRCKTPKEVLVTFSKKNQSREDFLSKSDNYYCLKCGKLLRTITYE